MLADPVVFPGSLDQLLAFPNIVGTGLLDISVLASLHGPDASQSMPVIRGGETDGIDFLIIEHLPHVAIAFRQLTRELFILTGPLVQDAFIDVAKGNDLNPRLLVEAQDVFLAPPASAHYSHTHSIASIQSFSTLAHH